MKQLGLQCNRESCVIDGTRLFSDKLLDELKNFIYHDTYSNDAFYDAHYTAEVFKAIYTNKLSPSTFTKNTEKKPKVKKEKLDSEALIKEFEKIYNRKMSKEEVKMIRLAYFMGKTKQFILKDE